MGTAGCLLLNQQFHKAPKEEKKLKKELWADSRHPPTKNEAFLFSDCMFTKNIM